MRARVRELGKKVAKWERVRQLGKKVAKWEKKGEEGSENWERR